MSSNFPWRALELLLTISLNYELRYFNSFLGWILVWAHKQYLAYMDMSNKSVQDIKRVESWEIERSKHKYEDMFRGLSHYSTSSPSHKRILIIHKGSFTKGPPPRNYNLQNEEYTTPTLIPLHKRVGTKPGQSKEKITT